MSKPRVLLVLFFVFSVGSAGRAYAQRPAFRVLLRSDCTRVRRCMTDRTVVFTVSLSAQTGSPFTEEVVVDPVGTGRRRSR